MKPQGSRPTSAFIGARPVLPATQTMSRSDSLSRTVVPQGGPSLRMSAMRSGLAGTGFFPARSTVALAPFTPGRLAVQFVASVSSIRLPASSC